MNFMCNLSGFDEQMLHCEDILINRERETFVMGAEKTKIQLLAQYETTWGES